MSVLCPLFLMHVLLLLSSGVVVGVFLELDMSMVLCVFFFSLLALQPIVGLYFAAL